MASSLTPNLRIRRATPEDIPSLVRVHFDAFGTGPNAVMHRLMYPDGANETIKTRFGKSFFPEDGASLPPFETLTMVAEVDNEQGQTEIAAFSKWKIVREPLPEEVWNKQESFTAGELGEGTNAAVYEEFLGGLHRLRRKWMKGDPCLREALKFTHSFSHSQVFFDLSDIKLPYRLRHPRRNHRPPAPRRRLRTADLGHGARGPRRADDVAGGITRRLPAVSQVWVRGRRGAGLAGDGAVGRR